MRTKALGIVLLVVGVALLVWGYQVYDSLGSQISRTLDGSSPAGAWVGMVSGAVCIGLGILRLRMK